MGRFTQGGVVYEELPDGNVRVVGYDDTPVAPVPQPRPMVVGTPRPAPAPDAPSGFRFNRSGGAEPIPGGPADPNTPGTEAYNRLHPRADGGGNALDPGRIATLNSLVGQINRVQDLFEAGPGSTRGFAGIFDYLPTEANRNFDTASANLAEQALAAFRTPGVGSQSDKDAARFENANLTNSWAFDSQNIERLDALRRRTDANRAQMGLPPANWTGTLGVPQRNQQPVAPASAGGGPRAPNTPNGPTVLPDASQGRADAGIGAAGVTATGGLTVVPELAGVPNEVKDMIGRGANLSQVLDHIRQRYAGAGINNINFDQHREVLSRVIGDHQRNPNRPVGSLARGWENLTMVPAADRSAVLDDLRGALTLGQGGDSAVGAAIISAANAVSGGTLANFGGDNVRSVMQYGREERPLASLAGDIGGSALAMYGINRGAALLGRALPGFAGATGRAVAGGGGILGDSGYGAFRGAMETQGGVGERIVGGLAGAGATAAGSGAGQYVLGPVATRFLDTGAGRAMANGLGFVGNRAANAARGMFGRTPTSRTPFDPPLPLSSGERAIAGNLSDPAALATTRDALDLASRNNVPLAPADTADSLRTLAGAAYRRASPGMRDTITPAMEGRAMGQADRALGYIENNFGPIGNPNEISQQLMEQARTASRPLYDSAMSQPAPVDPSIEAFLQRPAGRQALSHARNIAGNEGIDPNTLGFGMDHLGQITLEHAPSWRTLDYIKKGIDQTIEAQRDPITHALPSTPDMHALNGLRRDFVSRLDQLNPDYQAARQAYAGPASANSAMQDGRGALRLQPRDIRVQIAGVGSGNLPHYQLGARVAMGDAVNNAALTRNPLNAIYGSPTAQARVSTLFPQQADNFGQLAGLEGQMARTSQEMLGGSQTAARQIADQNFTGGVGDLAASAGIDMLTTGAPVATGMSLLGKAGRRFADSRVLGLRAQGRADQVLPDLMNMDPAVSLQRIDDLLAQVNARGGYVNRNRRRMGMFGSSGANAITGAYVLPMLTQQ